jgi:hypothetical protein
MTKDSSTQPEKKVIPKREIPKAYGIFCKSSDSIAFERIIKAVTNLMGKGQLASMPGYFAFYPKCTKTEYDGIMAEAKAAKLNVGPIAESRNEEGTGE